MDLKWFYLSHNSATLLAWKDKEMSEFEQSAVI